jgi:lambda repressor-like predicted transcriptional regulator
MRLPSRSRHTTKEDQVAAAPEFGWSMRAVSRAAELSVGTVRNLMRPELGLFLEGNPYGPRDALIARVLFELGAARPTNRADVDARTAKLLDRDRKAAQLLRSADEPLPAKARLLATGTDAWLIVRDSELLSALEEHPDDALRILPVGAWASAALAFEVKGVAA